MAASENLVREMLGGVYGNIPEEFNLLPYVTIAESIVEETLADTNLTAKRKDHIITFLSCHFATIALFNGGLVKKTVGQTSETYNTPDGKQQGYAITFWGKQALAIDSSGKLAADSAGSASLPAEFKVYSGIEYPPSGY